VTGDGTAGGDGAGARRLAAMETGGTKVICLVGESPDRVEAQVRFPTVGPAETLARAVEFFVAAAGTAPLAALGVGAFGPIQTRPDRPDYGRVAHTPKPGWSGADVLGPLRAALGVPVGLDTDVNGAARAEGVWGAARGLDTFVYMTVGTGIGVGAVIGGRTVRGLLHPEMGHVSVPRRPGDEFPGVCPYHGDCLEGMASGPALARRWGAPGETLTGAALAAAVETEAFYLAAGLRTIVYCVAPERIVLGGGLAALPGLLPAVRAALPAALGGYPGLAEHARPSFVVPAGLGDRAGPAGALLIAADAARAAADVLTPPATDHDQYRLTPPLN
jgi:fructokinase